ncbi:MAG TPA: FMN-binding protein [Candidatus Ventrousia excrementavium]|uniref:Ion-translocating oxidoreductase complex subunit G n=1 Tax=Candidatus Ventrousia excrementavium TaxID=2840961 RepID=A0A9D1IS00_9CLOT|nr:FMN-binding protein [Candidatus Ventrousia excrementavium]
MNKALKQSKFMQNPYVQEIIRLALPLLIITVIVAGVLGAVDAITADKIAELAVQKTQNAMGAIISGAQFESVDFTDETGIINEVYTASVGGQYAGMCIRVSPNGFSDVIEMIVGISPENTVLGVEIVSSSETSGLGSRASEDEWRAQFVGKTGPLTVQKNTATGENDIVAITGATITSRAVTEGVQAALDYAAAHQPEVSE